MSLDWPRPILCQGWISLPMCLTVWMVNNVKYQLIRWENLEMTIFTDDLIVCMNIFWPKRLYYVYTCFDHYFQRFSMQQLGQSTPNYPVPFKGGMQVYWNNWGHIIIIPGWLPLQYLLTKFMTSSPKPSPIILKLGMHHCQLWSSYTKFIYMMILAS